ncbi:hypothetical protein C8Q79DRAFT_930208 [Trametes meyenii]|nr:hypothetical protein C8Q79DRAFT_930208 [Trametes meyenii]
MTTRTSKNAGAQVLLPASGGVTVFWEKGTSSAPVDTEDTVHQATGISAYAFYDNVDPLHPKYDYQLDIQTDATVPRFYKFGDKEGQILGPLEALTNGTHTLRFNSNNPTILYISITSTDS